MATVIKETTPRQGRELPTLVMFNEEVESEPDIEGTAEQHPGPSLAHTLSMATAVGLPFLGCIVAIVITWTVGWMDWLFLGLLIGGWLSTGLGITIGYHRLFSHRSFDTYRWVRAIWMALGSLAVQGSPLMWCAVHRKHHEFSDHEGDPHSPVLHGEGWWNTLKGFVHSHTGWLFSHHWSSTTYERYIPDLLKDPWLVKVDRLYPMWILVSLAIPAVIGGLVTMSWLGLLLGFLWGGLVRIFFVHHITWSINSICHMFGSRDYRSDDLSRNNVICGVLGHGEGWHNNHHAFPSSARHGLKWWQFDTSWLIIRGMERLGLAWNVRLPSKKALAAKSLG